MTHTLNASFSPINKLNLTDLKPTQTEDSGSHHLPNYAAAAIYTREGNGHLLLPYLKDERLAPLTRWAQTKIYQHQHPADCSKARFMISDGYASGFGSEIHVIGSHLAYAIQNNYILLLSPRTCSLFVNRSTCKEGCGCYFRPLSHCGNITQLHKDKSTPRVKSLHKWGGLVPDRFAHALLAKMPSMTHAERKYWWRAQSAGYLLRLNDETVRALYIYR
jgi:hypothetical protein